MTTIACDGKSMAGDGLRTQCDIAVHFGAVKVRRLPNGSLYGAAGDSKDCDALAAWLVDGGLQPKVKSVDAIQLKPDGIILTYSDCCEGIEIEAPAAAGSGWELALGAMMAGATPAEAVEIAAKRDTGTGGKITVLHI